MEGIVKTTLNPACMATVFYMHTDRITVDDSRYPSATVISPMRFSRILYTLYS